MKIRTKIARQIDFLSDHWVKGDDRPPFSFAGWREEVLDALEKIVQDARDDAREEARQAVIRDIVEDFGDVKVVDGKTLRFYLLPHTQHRPGDDGTVLKPKKRRGFLGLW